MSDSIPSNPNYCEVCGKPAIQAAPLDPFGKSDALRHLCGEHGFRLRDPADVAEIERLTRELDAIKAQVLVLPADLDPAESREPTPAMREAIEHHRSLVAADGPAEQPVEIDARCQPTLTECPHCHNDLSKCVGLFKRPAEETSGE